MVGTRSLPSGARSRDPLALPTLRFHCAAYLNAEKRLSNEFACTIGCEPATIGAFAPCPTKSKNLGVKGMVGTQSLSSGARSRDPLALPTLRFYRAAYLNAEKRLSNE